MIEALLSTNTYTIFKSFSVLKRVKVMEVLPVIRANGVKKYDGKVA